MSFSSEVVRFFAARREVAEVEPEVESGVIS